MTTNQTTDSLSSPVKVSIRDLNFKRGSKIIFDNLSLDIPSGKVTAIMGPSGTGKTTLLNYIGGVLEAKPGNVGVDGVDVATLSHKELYRLRRRMGMVFQDGALFTDLNVFENVAFALRAHTNLPDDMLRDLVLMKLQAVGLRGAAKLNIDELSGGMARRVALARALALDPDLIMYDEPFTGQDPITRGVLLKLVRQINDSLGLTSILVTHDVKEAIKIADYVYVLSQGKVIGQGAPLEILHHETPALKQFIHGLPDGVVPFDYPAKEYAKELQLTDLANK